jgi:DNA-directed RNA polymerase specialized sigma24 family protein
MADLSQEIMKRLPYLRRYARALTGSQARGDDCIRTCLEKLIEEPQRISLDGDVRLQLYSLFHEIWAPLAEVDRAAATGEAPADRTIVARLEALPPLERQMLLLTALEGFSIAAAAQILKVPAATADSLLAKAWEALKQQVTTTVLVIEDEPVIALDIAGIVEDMGHKIVAIAANQSEAIALAREKRPGLVLADIQLEGGGSGLLAVNEILKSIDVPVIFVTAYPERLLTGERPEPTYLVTKPFEPDALKVTISQALSFGPPTSPATQSSQAAR